MRGFEYYLRVNETYTGGNTVPVEMPDILICAHPHITVTTDEMFAPEFKSWFIKDRPDDAPIVEYPFCSGNSNITTIRFGSRAVNRIPEGFISIYLNGINFANPDGVCQKQSRMVATMLPMNVKI